MDQPKNPNFSLERPTPPPVERSPENIANESQQGESAPQQEKKAEHQERAESPRPSQGVALPPVQIPVTSSPSSSPPTSSPNTADSPLTADDVDIIEMEWVKRAEQIIEETKDDPHAQEEAVEALQIEYLDKRYGKKIKRSRSE